MSDLSGTLTIDGRKWTDNLSLFLLFLLLSLSHPKAKWKEPPEILSVMLEMLKKNKANPF